MLLLDLDVNGFAAPLNARFGVAAFEPFAADFAIVIVPSPVPVVAVGCWFCAGGICPCAGCGPAPGCSCRGVLPADGPLVERRQLRFGLHHAHERGRDLQEELVIGLDALDHLHRLVAAEPEPLLDALDKRLEPAGDLGLHHLELVGSLHGD